MRSGIVEYRADAGKIAVALRERRHRGRQGRRVVDPAAIVIDGEKGVIQVEPLGNFEGASEIETKSILRVGSLGIGLSIQRERRGIERGVAQRIKHVAANLLPA